MTAHSPEESALQLLYGLLRKPATETRNRIRLYHRAPQPPARFLGTPRKPASLLRFRGYLASFSTKLLKTIVRVSTPMRRTSTWEGNSLGGELRT